MTAPGMGEAIKLWNDIWGQNSEIRKQKIMAALNESYVKGQEQEREKSKEDWDLSDRWRSSLEEACIEYRETVSGLKLDLEASRQEIERLKNALLKSDDLCVNRLEALKEMDAKNEYLGTELEAERQSTRELVECEPCPNCPDQGWWTRQNSNTGDPEQIQCEFCYTNPKSRFKALARHKAGGKI